MQVHRHLRVRHRLAAIVAVASLMGVSPCPAQDTSLAWAPASLRDRYLGPAGGARANFVWSVADRFGLDRNNDGFIDLPNTAEYIRPNTFTVTFDATPSVLPRPVGAQVVITNLRAALDSVHHSVTYEWRISGGPLSQPVTRRGGWDDARQWSTGLPQGVFTVVLVVGLGAWADTASAVLEVKDYLIVAIGDSYASGEGSPETTNTRVSGTEIIQTVRWADDGMTPRNNSAYVRYHEALVGYGLRYSVTLNTPTAVSLDHIRAHRSTLSWPAQVALAIEKADPHTSVTFVSVAASGATIQDGLLGPFNGVKLPFSGQHFDPMPPQIERVAQLVGNRKIDALLVSIGANDIGFRLALSALAIHGYGDVSVSYDDISNALHNGNWGWLEHKEGFVGALHDLATLGQEDLVGWEMTAGLDRLPSLYAALHDAIRQRLSVGGVYILEYADPTGKYDDDGNLIYCPHMLNDVTAPTHIDATEAKWGKEHVLDALNAAIHNAANANAWTYVGNIAWRFGDGHGICADPPYDRDDYSPNDWNVGPWPTGSRVAWFRPALGSAAIEGPFFAMSLTQGMMHPNEFGHQAIKEAFLARIVLPRPREQYLTARREEPIEARELKHVDQPH